MTDTRTPTPSPATLARSPLGAGGPVVSRFGLGTMTFGVETDEETAVRQLDLFTERGGTFIDTADVYGDGESERIIGRWIARRGRRDDIILATKGRFAPPSGSHGASRRALRIAVDRSLDRLQVDSIDLYFIHGWDKDTPVRETLDALADMVRLGRIHNIAWSNVTGWQFQKILDTAEFADLPRPVAVQPQYNLLDRGIELELLPCCLEAGIAITPWSPLGGGWLTGKYARDRRPEGESRLGENPERGVEAYDIRNSERTFRVIDALGRIAERHSRPMSHVALAWLLQRPGVASVLLGARTVQQLSDNIDAASLALDDQDMQELTTVSSPGLPAYPYGMIADFCGVSTWQSLGT